MFRHALTALLLAAILGDTARAQTGPVPNAFAPEISAAGRGETRIAPTSSSVLISVTTRSPTAAQAAADNATRLDATLRALRAAGLAANELTTAGYSVAQNYEMTRDGRNPAGFVARNTIRAEVRRLDDVGKVIDAALAGGATEISGIQYISANSQEARRTALADAVRHARAEAEAIARAAGGSLGRLITLSSSGAPQMRTEVVEFAAREAGGSMIPTAITPRDLTIVAQVYGRWEFVPGR